MNDEEKSYHLNKLKKWINDKNALQRKEEALRDKEKDLRNKEHFLLQQKTG
jgi:hypothetical protein